MVSMPAFQAEDEVSITFTRSTCVGPVTHIKYLAVVCSREPITSNLESIQG